MRYLQLLTVFCYFFSFTLYSQKSTSDFDEIYFDTLSNSSKEKRFINLINQHYKKKAFDSLFNDTYMLMRWFKDVGQLHKSIELNKRSLFLMDSINYNNLTFRRQNHYSLGYYLKSNNELDKAIESYYKVIEFDIDDKYAMYSYYYIGLFHYEKLDYYQAAEYFEKSSMVAKTINNNYQFKIASLYVGSCYYQINTTESTEKAIHVLSESLENKQLDIRIQSKKLWDMQSRLYLLLGTTYADRKSNEFNIAMFNFRKALEYAKYLNDSLRIADIYHDVGNLYGKRNDPDMFKYFDTALTYKPDVFTKYYLLDNIGNFFKRQEKFNDAKIYMQSALKILSPNISDNYKLVNSFEYFTESKDLQLTITSLINKAEIFIAEAEFTDSVELNRNAIKILETTDKLLDIVRFESNEFKTKLFWRNLSSRLYTNAVKACLALQDYERAFYFMEKNKSLLLLEDVLLEGQRNSANIPVEIIETHDRLRKDVLKYESAHDSLLREKLVAKANYNKFIDTLNADYKLYFKSLKPAEVISLDSFNNSINNTKHAYIEYILGEEEGFGMLISKDKVDLFSIAGVDSLRNQISEFKLLLKTPIAKKTDKEKYNSLSYSIYTRLFPKQIQPLVEDKNLTIIPDDVLLNIPFEALQTSNSDDDYLIYNHQISYANSLTFLNQTKNQQRENSKNAIGIAPINFALGMSTLENSRTEVEQLNLFKDSNLLLEDEATKQNLTQNLDDYKLVHISTHASSDKFREPYLALNDSLININELYLTRNTADLVVLSACETANGELYKGEGVLSLSRSFFNTGAKSVASTLWSIDDKSTSEIMASFYQNLNDGQSKSKALHQAKLDYLESHALSETSPYYWASFVLVGDTGPIDFYQDHIFYYMAIGIVLTVFLMFMLWKHSRKKRSINRL